MRKILFGQQLHLASLTLPPILVSLISVKWRTVHIFTVLKQSGLLLPCVFCHLHTQWVFKPYWFSLIVKNQGPRDAGITLRVPECYLLSSSPSLLHRNSQLCLVFQEKAGLNLVQSVWLSSVMKNLQWPPSAPARRSLSKQQLNDLKWVLVRFC